MLVRVAGAGGAAVRRRCTRRPRRSAAPAEAPVRGADRCRDCPTRASSTWRDVAAIGGRWRRSSRLKSMHATGTLSVPASVHERSRSRCYGAAPDRVLRRRRPSCGDRRWSVPTASTARALRRGRRPDDRARTPKSGKELEQAKLDADFYSELRDPKKYTAEDASRRRRSTAATCYKVSVKRTDGGEDFDFYDVATGLRAGSIEHRARRQMGSMTVTQASRAATRNSASSRRRPGDHAEDHGHRAEDHARPSVRIRQRSIRPCSSRRRSIKALIK